MLLPMSESAVKLELIAILDDVFRRRGYEGATLSELSRACSLGKASLYHHFPGGKDEMANVLLRRAIRELNDSAFRQLDRPGPWRERLVGFIDGFSRYCAALEVRRRDPTADPGVAASTHAGVHRGRPLREASASPRARTLERAIWCVGRRAIAERSQPVPTDRAAAA
jgi:AcrR family transcriptional regulator